jgi:hypothetical protein
MVSILTCSLKPALRFEPTHKEGKNMQQPYLALITPVSVGGGGGPTHPIAPGGQPPGIWGGAPSYPDQGLPPGFGGGHPSQGLPGGPNYPSQGPIYGGGHPSHGLPGGPNYPSQGPIYGGGHPSHPIYFPDAGAPGGGGEGETKPPSAENLPPIIIWIPGVGWIRALPGVPPKPNPDQPQVNPV